MGDARHDVPGTASVPVTGGSSGVHRAPGASRRSGLESALAHFHAQSYGKDVARVETLFFGGEPSNGLARPVPGQVRPRLPALAPLRALNAALPALGGPWSPAQRLLAACVEAVRVRRISAADRYPVHRAYPSPRGLFGADLFLLPREGGRWCLRVDPQSHALQPVGDAEALPDLEREGEGEEVLSEARLVVAVDPHRYPPEYGSLRPSLARLEGGHLLATLGLTLTRAGLSPRTHPDPAHLACAEAAPLLPGGMTPIAAISTGPDPGRGAAVPEALEVPGTAEASGAAGAAGASGAPGSNEASQAPPGAVGIAPEATARVAAAASPAGRSLRGWLDERTSGVSTANLVTSAYVSPEAGSAVTAGLTEAFAAVHGALPEPDALRLYRHVLEGDRVDERSVRELRADGSEGPARGVPRTGESNFSATLGYTLAVDFPAWARAHGARHAETVLHTLLGWIAQWGCLGAAATGLCARPMRNYSEEDWAAALGLAPGQTPAYQLWVRSERGTYLDVPVDAAPDTDPPEIP
ncbi:hypothetical protein GCM10007079_49630 [Nocardiopsis terrae]|uniref:SagB-type dehydrogenase domain-containing protein n=1 Tax=Nocardiopsis terrae TaxID=372655 RepID=A0ABR9HA57_9ACTN|nr:hypothetical protein [Nocardiopsis terrae]MBE1455919.1 hypothetical protein [Nocardiopsis terrae]GHC96695.1 hypothetical protein GCM10007079_49630 [Nocardiopsis terrae]